MGQLKHYEERWYWRLEDEEENPVTRAQPKGQARSQPELPLKAMTESVATQWQGSVSCLWLVLPLENMAMSLVRAAARDHVDVQGLYPAGPAPH